jgi:uncharacterized protein (DUF433 family)
MSVHRLNLRKVSEDLERQHAQSPESRPTLSDPLNDIERMQIVVRNVIVLTRRGWSERAIAEDLFPEISIEAGRARVRRILDRWRSGAAITADAL